MNRLLVLSAWLSLTCVMGPSGTEPEPVAAAPTHHARKGKQPSDHAPVIVEFDLDGFAR